MNRDPFKEYIKQSEPDKREKGYVWQTAIGLQQLTEHAFSFTPYEYLSIHKKCLSKFAVG